MSFYQKYRPTRIADLDLKSVREELSRILGAKTLPHAFLFVGPRGIGKTSAARILARVVNCEKSETKLADPCGKCASCKGITNQASVDVIEIDAASHRGIDDIRDLREKVKLAPVKLRRKVYIIDEVHMLTREAFNALLKTLEEPPEHALFVLCTTETHKIPETIASRCNRVIFAKADEEEVKASLMKVVKAEGIGVEEQAMDLLAASMDGSFREGHKLLEQLALSKQKIDVFLVKKVLGLVGEDEIRGLIEAVEAGDVRGVLEKIEVAEKAGVDVETLLMNLLSYLRLLTRERLLAGKTAEAWRVRLMEALIEVAEKVKQAPIPIVPLELVLVETAQSRSELGVAGGGEARAGLVKDEAEDGEEGEASGAAAVDRQNKATLIDGLDLRQVKENWKELIGGLADKNHSVAGLLRSACPKQLIDDCLEVEVFYEFHKKQLEAEVRRRMVEDEALRLWGVGRVRFVLAKPRLEAKKAETRFVADDETKEGKVDREMLAVAEEIFGA